MAIEYSCEETGRILELLNHERIDIARIFKCKEDGDFVQVASDAG